MKNGKKALLIFLLLFVISANAHRDFCVLTIPKCGTGLINKFFELALEMKCCPHTFREELCGPEIRPGTFSVEALEPKNVEAFFARCKRNDIYAFGHLNYALPFIQYIDNHPEYLCVMQIRDLRDACVSLVYWKKDLIDETLGKKSTFDEALMLVINGSNSVLNNRAFDLKANAERAVLIMNHPNVIVSRYEDLVGDQGGGSKKAQKKLITLIAKKLEIPMSPVKLATIMDTLWGNESGPKKATFREGKIGGWKKYFTAKHKKAFKQNFGELLIRLGYEKDNNW